MSDSGGVGTVGRGRPPSTGPTSAMPWLPRSNHQETPIAAATTINAPGRNGRKRFRQTSVTSATALTAMVAPLTSPSSFTISQRRPSGSLCSDLQAEQLAELRDHQRDRDAVQIADQHGSGEIVGDPADPQQPREEEADGDEEREHRGDLDRIRAARHRERQHRRGDEGRGRALGPDHEPARGAEQDVRDGREQQGVQPVDRRQAGELAIGHGRRHREGGDGQPGEKVTGGARRPIRRHVLGDGDGADEQRLLRRRPEGGVAVRGPALPGGGVGAPSSSLVTVALGF